MGRPHASSRLVVESISPRRRRSIEDRAATKPPLHVRSALRLASLESNRHVVLRSTHGGHLDDIPSDGVGHARARDEHGEGGRTRKSRRSSHSNHRCRNRAPLESIRIGANALESLTKPDRALQGAASQARREGEVGLKPDESEQRRLAKRIRSEATGDFVSDS
jgi:hypothetical protein